MLLCDSGTQWRAEGVRMVRRPWVSWGHSMTKFCKNNHGKKRSSEIFGDKSKFFLGQSEDFVRKM